MCRVRFIRLFFMTESTMTWAHKPIKLAITITRNLSCVIRKILGNSSNQKIKKREFSFLVHWSQSEHTKESSSSVSPTQSSWNQTPQFSQDLMSTTVFSLHTGQNHSDSSSGNSYLTNFTNLSFTFEPFPLIEPVRLRESTV